MDATVTYSKAKHLQLVAEYLKKTWFGWERLRIFYNVILLIEGLTALFYLRHLGELAGHRCVAVFGSQIWIVIIAFGALANVFYCLGPLTELFVTAFWKRRMERARYLLFAAGLLFSMLIIFALAIRGYTHISGYLE